MNIQQAINTTLGLSAHIVGTSPLGAIAKERALAQADERKAVKLEKQYEQVQSEIEKYQTGRKLTAEEEIAEYGLIQKSSDLLEQAYQTSPNAERLEAATTWKEVAEGWQKPEEIRQKATDALDRAIELKRNQQKSRELMSAIASGGQGIAEWKRKYGGEA